MPTIHFWTDYLSIYPCVSTCTSSREAAMDSRGTAIRLHALICRTRQGNFQHPDHHSETGSRLAEAATDPSPQDGISILRTSACALASVVLRLFEMYRIPDSSALRRRLPGIFAADQLWFRPPATDQDLKISFPVGADGIFDAARLAKVLRTAPSTHLTAASRQRQPKPAGSQAQPLRTIWSQAPFSYFSSRTTC